MFKFEWPTIMHLYLIGLLSLLVGIAQATLNIDGGTTFVPQADTLIETNEGGLGGGIVLDPTQPLVLQCNVSACSDCVIHWYRNGKQLTNETDHGKKYKVFPANNSLVLQKPSAKDDVGDYICALVDDNNLITNTTLTVVTEPYISPFGHSRNVVQGEALSLHCRVLQGSPKPHILWFKGDLPINSSDPRVSFSPDPENKIVDAILTITNLDFPDRAVYTCEANNGGATNSTREAVLVRVKDKLAALWPFLGICAEVAVLCTIIFVYERKKGKPDLDETDAEHNTSNKHSASQKSADKGKQEIRQRK